MRICSINFGPGSLHRWQFINIIGTRSENEVLIRFNGIIKINNFSLQLFKFFNPHLLKS